MIQDNRSLSTLEAARNYRRRGYWAVPIPPGQKLTVEDGWPGLRLEGEELDRRFDLPCNIGIILGEPSGWLVDVDLDCPEAIEMADRFLPPTGMISGREASPNSHRWFIAVGAVTKQHRDRVTKKMVIELRSTGAQTVVGPSVHPDGDRYEMLEGEPTPVSAEMLRACVDALYEAVQKLRHGESRAREGWKDSARPSTRSNVDSDDVLRRATAYLDAIPGAVSGHGGHPQTYTAATTMVHGFGLDPEVAFQLLRTRYNPRCDPPWTEKELWHKINDAATKPHERPHRWLADRPISSPASSNVDGANDSPEPLTDLGNAERFARMFGDQVRFCHATGKWLAWDKCRWRDDDEGTPLRLAGVLARQIAENAVELDDELRIKTRAWAKTCESRARHEAVILIAKSQQGCTVRVEDLDDDQWTLNVLNGTIDLRTGEIHPHDRDDLITKLAPVTFDPNATCPMFDNFLACSLGGDVELIEFVVRFFGHCLTGNISEQVFPIIHGAGANGKSVLLDTIAGIMGDYACEAPPLLLLESRHSEHPTEIADLRGRRLVVASETEDGAALKLQMVKRLTGDATLKGRYMRQDYFSFARTHKTLLVTNNRPQIREQSEAVWRRLRMVPFNVVIPAEDRDPKLIEKLKLEWPGILAKLVRGCVAWQRDGLGDSTAVQLATSDYKSEEDITGRFIEDCMETDEQSDESPLFTPWAAVNSAYEAWAKDEGERSSGGRWLGKELDKRGFRTTTRRDGGKPTKGRVGLRLRGSWRGTDAL